MPGVLRAGQRQAELPADPRSMEPLRAALGMLSLQWPGACPEVEGLHFKKEEEGRAIGKGSWAGRTKAASSQ